MDCLPSTSGVADMAPQTLDTELQTVISVLQQIGGVAKGDMPSAAAQVQHHHLHFHFFSFTFVFFFPSLRCGQFRVFEQVFCT